MATRLTPTSDPLAAAVSDPAFGAVSMSAARSSTRDADARGGLVELVSARYLPIAGHDDLRCGERATISPLSAFVTEVCGRWSSGAGWIETHLRALRPRVEGDAEVEEGASGEQLGPGARDRSASSRRRSHAADSTRRPVDGGAGGRGCASSPDRGARSRHRAPVLDDATGTHGRSAGSPVVWDPVGAVGANVRAEAGTGDLTETARFAAADPEPFDAVVAPWECLPAAGVPPRPPRPPPPPTPAAHLRAPDDWSARGF